MSAEKNLLRYECPSVQITIFSFEDIVTASNPGDSGGSSVGGPLGGGGVENDGGWTER